MTSSYTYTHSVETDVGPEAIWALYEDVTTWPSWDSQAERVIRDGPFQTGTTGTMKFVGQEPLAYRLAKVETPREFVDETPVGPLVVRVSHLLEPVDCGSGTARASHPHRAVHQPPSEGRGRWLSHRSGRGTAG